MFIAFLAAAIAPTSAASPAKPIAEGSWFSGSDYPAEAAKKGVEGSVTFEVDVDSTGKPTACRIAKSSGSDLLDQTTCRIVLAKSQFQPATVNGRPVPGRFSDKTVWRLSGSSGPVNGYYAAILDFKDPAHPTCSLVTKGMTSGPGCDEALQRFGQEGVREKVTKLVALMTITTGNKPYEGEADWGRRVAFAAVDLYAPKQGGTPACKLVAHEGASLGADPCSHYTDADALSEADKLSRQKLHVEQSVFAIQQQTSPSPGKCKDGESAAEAQSCI